VQSKVRSVLTAAGLDEAMTSSVVPEAWHAVFCPWSDAQPLRASTPMLKGADRLRCSLIPSLLEVRRVNQSLGNPVIELFETARIYLPRGGQLPREQWTLGITSGGDYFRVKGVVEAIVAALNPTLRLEVTDTRQPLLDPAAQRQLRLEGRLLGYLGELTARPEAVRVAGRDDGRRVGSVGAGRDRLLDPAARRSKPLPADRTRLEPDRRRTRCAGRNWIRPCAIRRASAWRASAIRKPTAIRRRTAGKKRQLFSITCARPNAR
jgi:hypothetical protein